MPLKKVNFYLSLYQAIGFTLAICVPAILWRKDAMGIFLVLLLGVAFLPFLFLSIASLLSRFSTNRDMSFSIGVALGFLVIPSWTLMLFYEWGGFLIALICTAIAVTVWRLKQIEKKAFVLHTVGSLLLSFLVFFNLFSWLSTLI